MCCSCSTCTFFTLFITSVILTTIIVSGVIIFQKDQTILIATDEFGDKLSALINMFGEQLIQHLKRSGFSLINTFDETSSPSPLPSSALSSAETMDSNKSQPESPFLYGALDNEFYLFNDNNGYYNNSEIENKATSGGGFNSRRKIFQKKSRPMKNNHRKPKL
ncbi:Serine/threonine-protein kinase QSK [Sarcoptes scabiei]|nr:Serine/threonine-protein kinase QSK [Sarcoptes scabiei]